jgi:hypothetical protein
VRPDATPIARPPLPQPIAPAASRPRPAPPTPIEPPAAEPAPPPVVASVEAARPPLKPVETGPKAPPIPALREGQPKEAPAPQKTDDPFADLDALEAEMSRLLGRESQS